MTTLPAAQKSSQIAEIATPWDHEYMPPYGLLAMPEVTRTGILNMVDFLLGSFSGLPVEEQPSVEWFLEKVNVLWPLTCELMQQIPRASKR